MTSFLVFIAVLQLVSSKEATSKRLLLHSEDDISQRLIKLETELETLKNSSKHTGNGSTYVRWGRNTCPGDNELVYHGYTAGKHWNTPGSGTDNLCLPHDPTWGNYVDGNYNRWRSHIFGAEIDIVEPNHIFPYAVNEEDMPCAVCKSPRSISLMIPARKECYPGWTMEYWGYLMAGHDNRAGAYDHMCMDTRPEFVPHGGTNDDQHILYLVEAQCGSLPCPPYVQGRELACVVCSK
ncbi:short-chain collagen C4-like [Mercenaria mercenaria]|uniref:short-chain collagen C4-like n=1 Tax=Mercenaria mercenaria TaxID=6596 RepID=UPI001E1D859B|nr:short-chain collagen C4-like [Mercenaria mercenaria]